MPATAVIAHGGGPTAVINASLAGVIAEARRHSAIGGLLGAVHGANGLVDDRFYDLFSQPAETVAALETTPGSALGSSRRPLTSGDDERIFDIFRRRDVRYFFYTGGNGSMDSALRFHRYAFDRGYELHVIGIPKTIDNDIQGTDHTPGYASCARFFAHAVRDIGADTRALPSPVTIVETLGRNTGWVVAGASLARHAEDDAPNLVYVPEFGVSLDQICADAESSVRRIGRCLIAVCEGQRDEQGVWFGTESISARGARDQLPANMGHTLARQIWSRTGIRARAEKPGLLGRSCQALASEVDREESRRCGEAAVRAAVSGESGKMVSIQRDSTMTLVPLEQVGRAERPFPTEWVNDRRNGILPGYAYWATPLVGEVKPHPRLLP